MEEALLTESLGTVEKTVYEYIIKKPDFSKSDIDEITATYKFDEFQVKAAVILLVLKKMIPRPY
jgi:hypothetical protein